MTRHPENTPKSSRGQHAELIEQFSDCSAHMPTSELVEILAILSVELQTRGANIAGITAIVDDLDEDDIEEGGSE